MAAEVGVDQETTEDWAVEVDVSALSPCNEGRRGSGLDSVLTMSVLMAGS